MKKPPFLQSGDWVSIVAPAGKIKPGAIEKAVEYWESRGHPVLVGQHVYSRFHQFAGTDAARIGDVQEALDNPRVRLIHFARGGYGSVRIVPSLDFTGFLKAPKWLVGFSDITVFHSYLNRKLGYCSIHGAMPGQFNSMTKGYLVIDQMYSLVCGGSHEVEFETQATNRAGTISNKELVGGNLSILYSLRGTPIEYAYTDKILFIEDIGEYIYHIDRIMMNLKLSGILKVLSGLIVGGFTEMKDQNPPFGQNVKEVIADAVAEYNYPVAFDFPAGHFPDTVPLMISGSYSLDVQSKQAKLIYEKSGSK